MVTDPLPGELNYLQTRLRLSALCHQTNVFKYKLYTMVKMKILTPSRNEFLYSVFFFPQIVLSCICKWSLPALSPCNTSPFSETDSKKKKKKYLI